MEAAMLREQRATWWWSWVVVVVMGGGRRRGGRRRRLRGWSLSWWLTCPTTPVLTGPDVD